MYQFSLLMSKMLNYKAYPTRVSILDPNISNYKSLIEVDRYFISANEDPVQSVVNTGGRASYKIAEIIGTCKINVDTSGLNANTSNTNNSADIGDCTTFTKYNDTINSREYNVCLNPSLQLFKT